MNIGISDYAKKRNKFRERGNLAPGFCTSHSQTAIQTDKLHQLDPQFGMF